MFTLLFTTGDETQFPLTAENVGNLLKQSNTPLIKVVFEQEFLYFGEFAVACPRGSDWRAMIFDASQIRIPTSAHQA